MSESCVEFERTFNTMAMNLVPRPWRIKTGVNPVAHAASVNEALAFVI